jgi:hypothetical protein
MTRKRAKSVVEYNDAALRLKQVQEGALWMTRGK